MRNNARNVRAAQRFADRAAPERCGARRRGAKSCAWTVERLCAKPDSPPRNPSVFPAPDIAKRAHRAEAFSWYANALASELRENSGSGNGLAGNGVRASGMAETANAGSAVATDGRSSRRKTGERTSAEGGAGQAGRNDPVLPVSLDPQASDRRSRGRLRTARQAIQPPHVPRHGWARMPVARCPR